MASRPFDHAVVAGGSIAGLLAARVLSSHFERVTLIERDALAQSSEPRKGVPQGRHAHALLIRGRSILESLFPGLTEELCEGGAALINGGREFGWYHGGNWRVDYESELFLLSLSRPFLEYKLAERVRALPNITILDGVRMEGFRTNAENAIRGVDVRARGGKPQLVETDLVLEATGRGSTTPQWISELGFVPPQSDLLPARVTYASCTFPRLNSWPERRALLITGAAARRSGGLFPIEGERWLVTLFSFFDEPTPQNHQEFLSFAKSLNAPDIHDRICASAPLSDVVHYRFPGSLRRRYEKLTRFPEGLIVLGDAVCSLNPVYGQGMTVSAIQAECLNRELTRAKREDGLARGFGRRWFRTIRPVINAAWDGVSIEDLRFPELVRNRPVHLPMLQWYMDRVHRATYRSPVVTDQFYRVINFLDPPERLFRPQVLGRALLSRRV